LPELLETVVTETFGVTAEVMMTEVAVGTAEAMMTDVAVANFATGELEVEAKTSAVVAIVSG
jgi:hypothetical protein